MAFDRTSYYHLEVGGVEGKSKKAKSKTIFSFFLLTFSLA
jgi:hypothetical protein